MMRIVPIACLKDNYAYLLIADNGDAAIIDPSEAAPVREALLREKATARAIWATHHHWDHVGGNEELARELRVDVLAHSSDRGRVPALTHGVEDGERIHVGELEARCLAIPGHTLGAVGYYVEEGDARVVFTGDTLFSAGCGRLFEGTPAQMLASLSKLAALPSDTRVFCGHEYTQSNLRFAAHVEPENRSVRAASEQAAVQRARAEPTVGTTVLHEREVNPFLRAWSTEIRGALGIAAEADDVSAFAAIRAAKDSFK